MYQNVSKIQNANIKFLEMNFLYGKNCRKTFMNKLYKEGTDEYRDCVLNKGKVKKN